MAQKLKKSSGDGKWSGLPSPVLDLILKLLGASAADYGLLRSVCSAWRSALTQRPSLPLLVVRKKQDEVFSFLALSGSGRLFSLVRARQLPNPVRFYGSSRGWLALGEPDMGVVLWNPVSGGRIRLPPLKRDPCKVFLSADPAASSDWVVLISQATWVTISFCRPGDEAWTTVTPFGESPPSVESRQWSVNGVFHGGRFFFVFELQVYACDLGSPPTVTRIPQARPPQLQECLVHRYYFVYLVESSRDLLLVVMSYPYRISKEPFWVEVFRMELVGDEVDFYKPGGLGDRALFVSANQASLVPASKIHGCSENCIYMTELPSTDERIIRKVYLQDWRTEFLSNPSTVYGPEVQRYWFSPSLS